MPNNNVQYELVLSASKHQIEIFMECLYNLSLYEKTKKDMGISIMAKMNANGFSELGKVKIIQEPYFENIEVGRLLGLFVNEELAKSIVVTVDLQATKRNLMERYGFSEVVTEPLVAILQKELSAYRDVLVRK